MRHPRQAAGHAFRGASRCGAALLLTGLVGVVLAISIPAEESQATTPSLREAEPYVLLQMNLCLSGLAACFDTTRQPRVVNEAVEVIGRRRPQAVTVNEACSGDIARIASSTQYHMRFSTVLVHGRPLRCVHPGRRGVFGNAVLTQTAIDRVADHAYTAQASAEERRFLCVVTIRRVTVCTTHLSTRASRAQRRVNDAQCGEFGAILAARAERGPLISAGDLNRSHDCAPARMWSRTDAHAPQLPGKQHGYGSARDFQPVRTAALPARYTDHGFLLLETTRRRESGAGPSSCSPSIAARAFD